MFDPPLSRSARSLLVSLFPLEGELPPTSFDEGPASSERFLEGDTWLRPTWPPPLSSSSEPGSSWASASLLLGVVTSSSSSDGGGSSSLRLLLLLPPPPPPFLASPPPRLLLRVGLRLGLRPSSRPLDPWLRRDGDLELDLLPPGAGVWVSLYNWG